MPTNQIVPEHDYAHTTVVIHDNSARPNDKVPSALETYCNMMFVFSSPKGIDRELTTVAGGFSDFTGRYGVGTFDVYGQPYFNAYAAAKTNAATLHCLRVTADDATYAVGALVAHYRAQPGTPAVQPDPVSTSQLDLCGHDLYAMSTQDEESGLITLSVAGTAVEAGISAENAATFGSLSGEYVDLALALDQLIPSLEDGVTYQVTQINPALVEYLGKDEFVFQENGLYKKVRTYSGAALKEGFCFLVPTGVASVTFEIAPYGELPEPTYLTNNTDLGVSAADPKTIINVGQSSLNGKPNYVVDLSGQVVSGVTHAALWGTPTGNNLEVDLNLPGLDPAKQYRVLQRNNNLSQYAGDPNVNQTTVTIEGSTYNWLKDKTYSGADIGDTLGILMGENGNAYLAIYEVGDAADGSHDELLMQVTLNNALVYVLAHSTEPNLGVIGDVTTIKVDSCIASTTNDLRSVEVQALAKLNAILKAITPAATEMVAGNMDVYYTFESLAGVTDRSNLGNLIQVDTTPDAEGFTACKAFEIACRGRGAWGNNLRFVLNSYPRGDRLSQYKNYTLSIYEIEAATLYKREEFTVSFVPGSTSDTGDTLFADFVVGDPFDNSSYIDLVTNTSFVEELFGAYQRVMPDTSLTKYTFDPICGGLFATGSTLIPNFSIDTTSNGVVSVMGMAGIPLSNGSDGAFDANNPNREQALADAYLRAYSGEIDRNVRSRKLFPTDLILDANFNVATKIAIHTLCTERKDCMAMFDLGTEMNTYAALTEELADIEPYITDRAETIEAYWGRIQDPVSFKIVPVTSTYALAQMYPTHFQKSGTKHVPLAGTSYGVVSGFLSGTAWPVYDDDLDSKIMDQLTESKVNFLKVNTRKQVVRAAQDTRQDIDTNLSEASNVFVLHDIRREAIALCELYEYNFSEPGDLARFNKAAGILADQYRDAQVSSISAAFDMNDWESERGILHLYIDFVHKNIVKRSIVEINVNRGVVDA